jgi:hypothetical protein
MRSRAQMSATVFLGVRTHNLAAGSHYRAHHPICYQVNTILGTFPVEFSRCSLRSIARRSRLRELSGPKHRFFRQREAHLLGNAH